MLDQVECSNKPRPYYHAQRFSTCCVRARFAPNELSLLTLQQASSNTALQNHRTPRTRRQYTHRIDDLL
jgi:hypothetical protein